MNLALEIVEDSIYSKIRRKWRGFYIYIGYDSSTCDHPEMITKIKKGCLIRLKICQTQKKAYSARFEAFGKKASVGLNRSFSMEDGR